jgi:prolipoprotein diacylglyceryltransferase
MNVSELGFNPAYGLPVGIALLVALLLPVARPISNPRLRRQYYLLQGITLLAAVVGAKLAVLVGDLDWPFVPLQDWHSILYSGKSIVGALIFGLLAAELAKPLLRYPLPPNDRFAALVPFSIAFGRVGCLLQGCCRGVPYDGPCAITYDDGIPRHPAQAYEIAFNLAVGITFVGLVKSRLLYGRVFSVYLIFYGLFRFGTEFIRETPKNWGPLSAYQVLSLVMVGLGAAFLIKRTFWPPKQWPAHGS